MIPVPDDKCTTYTEEHMISNIQKIHTLLKGIETGALEAALVVNEQVYV